MSVARSSGKRKRGNRPKRKSTSIYSPTGLLATRNGSGEQQRSGNENDRVIITRAVETRETVTETDKIYKNTYMGIREIPVHEAGSFSRAGAGRVKRLSPRTRFDL